MPVFAYVHENAVKKEHSDKATALVEAAIQSVVKKSSKSIADKACDKKSKSNNK
jgi:hypothetical protein